MNTRLIAAVILGSFVLAGCGGGSSDTAQDEADMQVADAQQERIDELEEDLAAAQERARQAEAARQREQAERERLEREAEEAAARARRAGARSALDGLGEDFTASVSVTPRYSALATVIADPTSGTPNPANAVPFASKSRSSASGWSVTTLSNTDADPADYLVVYSNVGPPTRVLLTDAISDFTADDNPKTSAIEEVRKGIQNADGRDIRSGSFPTQEGDNKSFDNNYDTDDPGDSLPNIVRISGYFHDAPGHFQCTADDQTPCTIGRRGDRYTIESGSWAFHAADTARALVDDGSYMYFGWWKREPASGGPSFLAFADGMGADNSATRTAEGNFDNLGGSATYRGPAVGQYAIYQALGAQSSSGSFTARAELTADFTANMLSGTVSNFSNSPDWTVTLSAASMEGGNVDGTAGDEKVGWTIGDDASARQGDWEAEFFSEAEYVGQVPDGVVGTFSAIFDGDEDEGDEVGRIVGAFGARK